MNPTVIDLFAGVGGLSLGFEKAGFQIVLANEYDAEIAEAYQINHKTTNMVVGDITSLDLEKTFGAYAGTVDVVIGGPPCQGFSQKGQRKTIHDERNFLFKYYVKVVELVRPRYFVMENVPNLLTAEGGYFKKEIEELFNSLGYSLTAGVLNASDYGVPQNRKRAVIIGKRDGVAPELPKKSTDTVTVWDAIEDLAFLESGEGTEEQNYRIPPNSAYARQLRGSTNRLYNHVATKHSPIALERLSLIPPDCGKEFLPNEHLTKSIYSGTWSRMIRDAISVTITTRFDTPSSGRFTHPYLACRICIFQTFRWQKCRCCFWRCISVA